MPSFRRCCVPTCTYKNGTTKHRFPNPNKAEEIERFNTWILNIGGNIAGEDNTFIYRNRRICHRHFINSYTLPNNRLTSFAIPTLHLPESTSDSQTQHVALDVEESTEEVPENVPSPSCSGSISDSQKQHVELDVEESTEEVPENVPSRSCSDFFEEIGMMHETIDLEEFTQSLDNLCKEFNRLNKLFSENPTPFNLKAMQTLTSYMRNYI